MKTPTLEEIIAARTGSGGWTRHQFESWGVPYPPPKGWQRGLIAGKFNLASMCRCGHIRGAHIFNAAFEDFWINCINCQCVVFSESR